MVTHFCVQYKVGQLYMIAKHSSEQSQKGEGVEVVENRPHEDPEHGLGQFTEKRIHLSSKLPSWIRYLLTCRFTKSSLSQNSA